MVPRSRPRGRRGSSPNDPIDIEEGNNSASQPARRGGQGDDDSDEEEGSDPDFLLDAEQDGEEDGEEEETAVDEDLAMEGRTARDRRAAPAQQRGRTEQEDNDRLNGLPKGRGGAGLGQGLARCPNPHCGRAVMAASRNCKECGCKVREERKRQRCDELDERMRKALDSGKFWDLVKTLGGVRRKMDNIFADSGGHVELGFFFGYKSMAGKMYIFRYGKGVAGESMASNDTLWKFWKENAKEELRGAPGYRDDEEVVAPRPQATLQQLIDASNIRDQRRKAAVLHTITSNGFTVDGVPRMSVP